MCRVVGNAAVTGVVVVTARALGPTGRGILVLLLTLASVTLLICSVGLNTSGRIHLVGDVDRVEPAGYLGLSALLSVVQMFVCVGLGAVLLPLVDIGLSMAQHALFGLLGGTLLAPFLLNAAINAYGHTTMAAAVDAAGKLAQLAFTAVLVVRGVSEVTPYLVALVGGNVVQTLLGLLALKRIGVAPRLGYRPAQWRSLIRTGVPGIALDLSQAVSFRLDRYIIGLFLTPAAVGIYSVAATAPEILRLPGLALSQPIFHRLASGAATISDFARTRLLSLALTALLGAAAFFVAPWAVRTFFGPEYLDAVTPLRILLFAELGMTLFYFDGSLLAAGLKRVGDASRAAFAGLVVVAGANVALIPHYGLAGAAWGSVIAYSVVGIMAHLLLRRRLLEQAAGGAQPAVTR